MSNEQKRETLITIVGASQSGKTTLAAGLAKTSCDDFNVGFADNATRDYLQPRIAGISAGHWPEATSGEDRDICLNVNTPGGRSALISFKEYMGERIRDATYLEQIVGKPNGALILLSPGMESLRDPMQREELIGNLKGIIDHLKVNKCVAIAFVVTACDRLKTDLKAFAPSFENYAGEVTNYLNTSGMHWKRFDVTITGELQDQDKPSIAYGKDNTSRDPFVWIMDRVVGKKHMSTAKRFLGWTGAVMVASLLLGGGICSWQWWAEGAKLHTCKKAEAEVEKRIADAISRRKPADLKMATDDLQGLITSNANLVCRWESHAKTREENAKKWSKRYDENRAEYFLMAMNSRYEQRMTREGTEDNCKGFDGELARFNPVDATLKEPLARQWNELRPKIREAYDVNHGNELEAELAKYKTRKKEQDLLDDLLKFKNEVSNWETTFEASAKIKVKVLSAIANLEHEIYVEVDTRNASAIRDAIDSMNASAATNATHDALESLRQRIAQWTPHTDGGEQQKTTFLKDFESQQPNWKQKYLDSRCAEEADTVVKEIHALKPDDQPLKADVVRDALKTAYGFASQYADATPEIFCAATNKIDEACGTFLDSFQKSFAQSWNVSSREAPKIDDHDIVFVEAALDVANPCKPEHKLSDDFLVELRRKCEQAKEMWCAAKKKVCEDFIGQTFISGRKTKDVFDDYRKWYEQNSQNPYVTNVNERVRSEVTSFFNTYVENYVSEFRSEGHVWKSYDTVPGRIAIARTKFEEFQCLCIAVARDPYGLSKDSRAAVFARLCCDKGEIKKGFDKAFAQYWTIRDVEVKVDYKRTYGRFEGLAVGCSLKLAECDASGNIPQRRFVLWEKMEENKITGQNNGRRLSYYKGNYSFSTNPWKDVYLSIPMTECIDWGLDNDFLETCSIWGLEKGKVERSFTIDRNELEAVVTFTVLGSLEGPTLEGLWAESEKLGK